MIRLLAQAQDQVGNALTSSPITTGVIFFALTAAITYLYRARDTDRDSEKTRLLKTIERQEKLIEQLQRTIMNDHHNDDQ